MRLALRSTRQAARLVRGLTAVPASPLHVAQAAPETHAPRRDVATAATAGGAGGAGSTKARARLPTSPEGSPLRPPSLTAFTDGGDAAAAAAFSGDLVVLGVWADDLEGGAVAAASDDSEDEEEGGEGGADPLAATTCLFADAAAAAWDARAGGLLSDAARAGGFKGKAGQAVSVRLPRAAGVRAATVVGLGKRSAAAAGEPAWGASPFAALGAAAAAAAKAHKAKTGAIVVTGPPAPGVAAPGAAAALARGVLTGAHAATRFKHGPAPARLDSAAVFGLGGGVEAGAREGAALARGIMLARYLVEAPPNVCTPAHVARAAADIAASAPDVLSVRTYGRAECEAMGMGAFLGVARASAREPVLIHLTYTPPGGGRADLPALALVGKGITFDSGGYNLKVGGMIESMKFDMAGSAAVLGAADALAAAKPAGGPVVHIVAACCENLIGPDSLLPGDILTTASGKTVEVNNTDAEGRLILADAMWYAQERAGAAAVVDIATLTGACMVGLGQGVAAFYTPEAGTAAAVAGAARAAGEKLWRMPLEASYWAGMASPVADMKNAGGRFGGSITAALFLQKFVNAGVAWSHLDIAGPAWDDKAGGATGFGVATLFGLASAGVPAKAEEEEA